MKKKLLSLLLVCAMVLTMVTGCAKPVEGVSDANSVSMFVEIERAGNWIVVYHRETKVMYAVSNDRYNYGSFTLLVDENGNPLLYK